ncbi:hypothetical protein D3C80_1440620 [compost metagenome]
MRGRLMQGAQPAEVLLRGQQVLDAGGMADPQQVVGQLRALLIEWLAIEQHLAAGGLHQPGEQAQQAGLATAVGAADLQHVTAAQLQFEVLEEHSQVSLAGERYGL